MLSGGGSDPEEGNSLDAWTDAYDACQQRALKTRLGIPVLYGIDGVHGHNNVIGAVIFPHHIGLGCTRDPELVEEVGRITAKEIRATGIQWTFAPCVTVPRDERWGRTYEGFSEDPDLVAELGEAMTRGLQGERLSDPLAVLACAKHFVGDGGTSAQTGEYQQGTTAFGNGGDAGAIADEARPGQHRKSTKRRCAAFISHRTCLRSKLASAPSCRRIAAGMA